VCFRGDELALVPSLITLALSLALNLGGSHSLCDILHSLQLLQSQKKIGMLGMGKRECRFEAVSEEHYILPALLRCIGMAQPMRLMGVGARYARGGGDRDKILTEHKIAWREEYEKDRGTHCDTFYIP
jgi:hypothetical protein